MVEEQIQEVGESSQEQTNSQEEIEENTKKRREKRDYKKTYVITAAQACYYENNDGDCMPYGGGLAKAVPNTNLLRGFETLAKDVGGELIIIPIAGKRTTEDVLHQDLRDREDIFHDSFMRLNRNIQLRDLVVPPQNVDPSTGKKNLVSKYSSSLVFGHSKQRVVPVPVFNSKLPRYIYTTGAVTLPNYNTANSKGDNAERNHVFGGLIVEVIDDVYYNIRNLRALNNGKFVDLGMEYDGQNAPKRVGVDSLVLGDIHWGDHDESAIKANYEMIEKFQPDRIFLHDFFNGHSINHHEADNILRRAREFKKGRLSLEEELRADYKEIQRLAKLADSVKKGAEIDIVSSNHHAFLTKYINGLTWAKEPWNIGIGADLTSRASGLTIPENQVDDAAYLFEEGLKRFGPLPSNVRFLKVRDDYRRFGYQLAIHGDKGASGARGGNAVARSVTGGGKSITGHSHNMEIFGDTYIVGTSGRLDLPYTAGSSNAQIAANAVLYKNGTVQMIPIIEGRWRTDK